MQVLNSQYVILQARLVASRLKKVIFSENQVGRRDQERELGERVGGSARRAYRQNGSEGPARGRGESTHPYARDVVMPQSEAGLV